LLKNPPCRCERGYFTVAKSYIIYRYEHEKSAKKKSRSSRKITENALIITKSAMARERFSESKLTRTLLRAAEGYDRVIDVPAIIAKVRQEMYEGIKTKDIHEVLIMVVRSFIERDPAHSFVAARSSSSLCTASVMGEVDYEKFEECTAKGFIESIKRGVELGQFDPRMLDFDPPAPCRRTCPERDRDFKYLGSKRSRRTTSPKSTAPARSSRRRRCSGCALPWAAPLPKRLPRSATAGGRVLRDHVGDVLHALLPHALPRGLKFPQLSSCFLSTVPDDLHAIFKEYSDGAQLLKYAGGIGTDWTPVRAPARSLKHRRREPGRHPLP
jgi:ribonucleoside-diphosphate reductase alpha chain